MILIEKSKTYATEKHRAVNHFYGQFRYEHHLHSVFQIGQKFIDLIPKDAQEIVLAACWCHDMIEDTRETYNDVKKVVGEEVADLVYAVTNEKGKNRKERANDKYYHGIVNQPYATFIKLCDRIANCEHNGDMNDLYRKEYPHFRNALANPIEAVDYTSMWKHLEDVLSGNFQKYSLSEDGYFSING